MESQFTNQENSGQEYSYYYSAPDLTVEDIPNPENRKFGLGRAIAAQILASVSIIVGFVAFYVLFFSIIGFSGEIEELGVSMLFFGFFFTAGGVAMSIVAIVLGVRSIKCFKRVTPRPIATLVLGISSLAEASSSIVVAVYDLFIILIALIAAAAI